MRQNTRLDTSNVGHHHRYSFLETPMEMRGPVDRDGNHGLPPPPGPLPDPDPALIERPHSNIASEKEQELERLRQLQLQQERVSTPYNGPPLPEQHPAHFAPYAEDIGPPSQAPSTQTPQSPDQPPNSPGPIPVKTDPEIRDQPQQNHVVSIAPDSNPLQSPRSPVSPRSPPAAVGTFRSLGHGTLASDDIYAYHLPGQISHPNQEIKGGTWSHGLCDCSDIGTCCLGIWCPCILYGRTQYRLGMKSRKEDPTNLLGYEKCNGSCTVMTLLCGCQWLLATIQHTRTRKAYHIKGDIASDCVRASCCTCCTLIQDEREIKKREASRGKAARAAGANLVSPYTAPVQMSYATPPPR